MNLSAKQTEFLEKLSNGKNLFLTGKAGTGKTFVVKEAMRLLDLANKKYIALAPTGIAAHNIGGQTLHSFFSFNPFGVMDFDCCNWLKGEKRRLINNLDTIFIDEISMLRPDILDAINWTIIKNGCRSIRTIQIVFIGDLKQLPSPIDDNTRSVLLQNYDGEYFHHSKIFKELDVETIELDEVLRQSNEEFIANLNIVRDGGKSEYFKRFVGKEPRGIILAPHNTTVAQYNLDGFNQNTGKEYTFTAQINGNVKASDFAMDTVIRVKPGCKIMYLVNSKNNNLINGTLGTFEAERIYEEEHYFINVGGVRYALEPSKFEKKEYVLNKDQTALELQVLGDITQYPFKLAYALTIHKSQGLTFDEVTVDLSLPCFAKGQLYTALSRVKSPEGLTLIIGR